MCNQLSGVLLVFNVWDTNVCALLPPFCGRRRCQEEEKVVKGYEFLVDDFSQEVSPNPGLFFIQKTTVGFLVDMVHTNLKLPLPESSSSIVIEMGPDSCLKDPKSFPVYAQLQKVMNTDWVHQAFCSSVPVE